MKKIIALIITGVMLLTLGGCKAAVFLLVYNIELMPGPEYVATDSTTLLSAL